jgi:hypothetical protein
MPDKLSTQALCFDNNVCSASISTRTHTGNVCCYLKTIFETVIRREGKGELKIPRSFILGFNYFLISIVSLVSVNFMWCLAGVHGLLSQYSLSY